MALYYFDVDDNGTFYPDDEGTDCDTFDRVKEEAIRALVEMIKDSLPDGDRHKLVIKVRDDGGDLVLKASLNFEVEAEHRSYGGSSPDSHV
ncbi:hypothetical protein FJV76_13800 [Mesorhizobium sp. WSM4303]|uniref:DUF6894 family protein n=1 Tax=unclassified Mesorhizobium TaxID=325217 RepID=UPI00115D7390|nr:MULTISPECIES: hypothetical protein [unclassified Mesorhizobium]TRC98365.1 hypothetical protein FJV77_07910 [Mesorhizobium sp. WSM4306]TRD04342.1 hypothetical protein FJV76_13800 [Mesorhizobium sp. WSM4303]